MREKRRESQHTVIPTALRRRRLENRKFKVSLGSVARSYQRNDREAEWEDLSITNRYKAFL